MRLPIFIYDLPVRNAVDTWQAARAGKEQNEKQQIGDYPGNHQAEFSVKTLAWVRAAAFIEELFPDCLAYGPHLDQPIRPA